ncbi:hypothetical protein D3C72_1012530 [compost metagenome]
MARFTGFAFKDKSVIGSVYVVEVTKGKRVVVRLPDGSYKTVAFDEIVAIWSASWEERNNCLNNDQLRSMLGKTYYEKRGSWG